jgi:hypothetical protein
MLWQWFNFTNWGFTIKMNKYLTTILLLMLHHNLDAQVTLPNLQSLQYVKSNLGNALNFDGTSTYAIGKAYLQDSLIDFTLEFWVKNTGTDGSNDRIFSSYLNDALEIGKSATQLKLLAPDLGGPITWQTVCSLELNVWIHIAVVRSGTDLKVYKNGTLMQTYTVDAVSFLPSFFRLGGDINGTGENGNFSIDELRLWKIPVSASYIQKYMYSSINPNSTLDHNPSTKLVLYYRFDQGEFGGNNANELGLYNSATSN